MPIKNYTTSIDVNKTAGEIVGILSGRGVRSISTLFDDDSGVPSGVAFSMVTEYGQRDFALPVRTDGILKVLLADKKVPAGQKTREQAARIAWRIAKEWLEVQGALIDASLATLDEVMFPYMVANERGETVFQVTRTRFMKELER